MPIWNITTTSPDGTASTQEITAADYVEASGKAAALTPEGCSMSMTPALETTGPVVLLSPDGTLWQIAVTDSGDIIPLPQ